MSGITESKEFCGPIPVFRRSEIPVVSPIIVLYFDSTTTWSTDAQPQVPFGMELLPTNEKYIYDKDRIKMESISLSENIWWYLVPSLECVVFFVYIEHETTPSAERVESTIQRSSSSSGLSLASSENEDVLYSLRPCTYEESRKSYEAYENVNSRSQLARWVQAVIGMDQDYRRILTLVKSHSSGPGAPLDPQNINNTIARGDSMFSVSCMQVFIFAYS